MRRKISGIPLIVACAAMLSVLASCAPTYDNIADQMLADTQKQADAGLLKLETLATTIDSMQNDQDPDAKKVVADAKKQAGFASNTDFYDQLQSSISTLTTRMTAMPDLSTPKLNTALSKLDENVAAVQIGRAHV
jgi:type II secretory pathway component PulK